MDLNLCSQAERMCEDNNVLDRGSKMRQDCIAMTSEHGFILHMLQCRAPSMYVFETDRVPKDMEHSLE